MPVPGPVEAFIRDHTLSYGKIKLVLKRNRYFVESPHPEMLQLLLKDTTIRNARIVTPSSNDRGIQAASFTAIQSPSQTVQASSGAQRAVNTQDEAVALKDDALFTSVVGIEGDEIDDEDESIHTFEIASAMIGVRFTLTTSSAPSPAHIRDRRPSRSAVTSLGILCLRNMIGIMTT